MKKALYIFICACLIGLSSCSEYQKLLKSTDPELKYQKALEYFDKGDYMRAQTLFDDVTPYYRGTERAEDVLHYVSQCYYGQKLYESACDYYLSYIRNYPKGKYIADARFMAGHCCYMDSPDARLDQATTKKAIEYLNQFVEIYPESEYAATAYKELEEMLNKLAQKEYLSAKLYYNLGSYLGNNYESAAIVAKNALKKYPGNSYQEELLWIILQSKYQQVLISVQDKKQDRARDTIDEYYNFINDYPDSKHRKAANKILTEMQKITNEQN